ncbi:MAG: hypothetical protein ACOCRX_04790 [Candidatus Woesearchaeota archaeon]
MNENQKIYTVFTTDYKGTKTSKGSTFREDKAKELVKYYNDRDIKADYEEGNLYDEEATK